MEILLALGIGVGLSSVAGVRAFLPLVAALTFVVFASFGNPPFLFMQINNRLLSLPGIVALLVFLVLECALDKSAALERPLNRVMVPVRAVVGAAVFAIVIVDRSPDALLGPMSSFRYVALPGGLSALAPYLIAGAVIAGAVAVLKVLLRPPARDGTSGVSTRFLSVVEDVVALVGGILGLYYVPLVSLLLVGFLLFFYYRVKRRRSRRFAGLRVLGD